MHRIDSSGSVAGLYSAGNPATGQRATLLDAEHLNALQEEICAVIEAAEIDLEKGQNDQLLEAITALIGGIDIGGPYLKVTDVTKFGSNANGYYEKRANGVIEQWGKVVASLGQGAVAVTFPIPFTDANSVMVSPVAMNSGGGTGTGLDIWAQWKDVTVGGDGFTAILQDSSGTATASGLAWRAVGI